MCLLATSMTSCVSDSQGMSIYVDESTTYNLNGPVEPENIRERFDVTINIVALSVFGLLDDINSSMESDQYKNDAKYAMRVYSRFLFALLQYIRKLEPELLLEYDRLVEQL